MDVEVCGEFGLARLLKIGDTRTPALVSTLRLDRAAFAFSDPPVPWASICIPPERPLDPDVLAAPQTPLAHLAGAEGLYTSQSLFPKLMVSLRRKLRPDQLVFAPLLSLPHRYALHALLGIDLFDTAPIVEASRAGLMFTPDGWRHVDEERPMAGEKLMEHNTRTSLDELANVRQCILSRSLRVLAESRAAWDPWAAAVLSNMDREHYDTVEQGVPVCGGRLPTPLPHSMYWPEIRRYRERVAERYARPDMADVLMLLPCSASKPYSLSKSHRAIRSVLRDSGVESRVHEVIVTSPLGIVPRELETFHPCMQYDTSVTGLWTAEEGTNVRMMLAALTAKPYERVILHIPENYRDVVGLDGDITCRGRVDSEESLRSLWDVLSTLEKPGSWRERQRQDMCSRLRFQFGPGAEIVAQEADIKGRYPNLKILAGEQRGMLTGQRGMISLTMHGGRLLAEIGLHTVQIEDFMPRGDVFAVGVQNATQDIREGDDVVVVHDGELRAVGVANMSWRSIVETRRGVAVRTRAHV